MQKSDARAIVRERLDDLQNKKELSDKICKQILDLNLQCKNILLYKALDSEVNVDPLIDAYLETMNVYLPKIVGRDIVLVKVDKDTKYEKGMFGIKEPIGEELDAKDVPIDICIAPLLGFDAHLNRLGKGKGYFDRYFDKANPKKIGVAFEVQKVSKVDFLPYDHKLDMVVTEVGIYENN